MVSVQEPEVQFAQRLASNEKPVRTKAIKKLRKYISVRSQKATGGFTGDELLKLWKGLFYCLWMQDKPLLQEELSRQISGLIHSFQDAEGQFLFLESFLQTFKREWTGLDRLRMDKFFQLIRFVFRQTFEMLKKTSWDSRLLRLLTVELLQSGSGAPSGLQFHILDLYMTELAAVGSAELTAEQNLTFIEPFCKVAAKTKDRSLFGAICSSIFSTIIDQAPFAIEDLMKEMKAAEASDSDSGQASEEDDKEDHGHKAAGRKLAGRPINGNKSNEEEEDDEDELLHLEESDTEAPCDEDLGPVLQFDYGALAAKLLELSSRSNTPNRNRQRLYKIVKSLRDLSEGIFPQDEYPEEVSTDEDDDMFGSRKRMKRAGGQVEEEEEGAPAAKKRKGKKKKTSLNKQNKDSAGDESGPADLTANNEKKKKRKKKKKTKAGQAADDAKVSEQEQIVTPTEGSQQEVQTQSAASEVATDTLILPEVKRPSVTVTEEDNQPTPSSSNTDVIVSGKKKKKKSVVLEAQVSAELTTGSGEELTPVAHIRTSTRKKKEKKKNLNAARSPEVENEAQVNGVGIEEESPDTKTPGKEKNKNRKAGGEVEVNEEPVAESATAPPKRKKEKGAQEDAAPDASPAAGQGTATPLKKKGKKNQGGAAAGTPHLTDTETSVTTPAKKKKKKLSAAEEEEMKAETAAPAVKGNGAEEEGEVFSSQKPVKRRRKIPVVFEFEADEMGVSASVNGLAEEETLVKKTRTAVGEPSTPVSSKKPHKTKTSGPASDFVTFQSDAAVPTPLFCKTKGGPGTPLSGTKTSRTPRSESKKVTFGLKNNKTAEFRKTDRSLLVSPDGSSRVPFDPEQKPKFGVLKSPVRPLSAKVRKTPTSGRKGSLKSTPKGRPTAADFF